MDAPTDIFSLLHLSCPVPHVSPAPATLTGPAPDRLIEKEAPLNKPPETLIVVVVVVNSTLHEGVLSRAVAPHHHQDTILVTSPTTVGKPY